MSPSENSVATDGIGDVVAVSVAHDIASPSKVVSQVNKPMKLTTFAPFLRLPAELQAKIWEEALNARGPQGINFVKLYMSVDRRGLVMAKHTRLDKHAKAAFTTNMKSVNLNSKKHVEHSVRVAIARGEKLMMIDTEGLFGQVQVQVNVDDIICFDLLHEDLASFGPGLPTKLGGIAIRRCFFTPAANPFFAVDAKWSWIRRLAVSFPVCEKQIQAMDRYGPLDIFTDHGHLACYYSLACNISGLRGLEEFFFVVADVAKPGEENPHKQLTKISSFLYNGPSYIWSDLDLKCDKFDHDVQSQGEPDEEDEEPDPSLKVFHGATHEYYQIRLGYRGIVGSAHHCLRHLARQLGRSDDLRVLRGGEEERVKDVEFKLMSYMK